MENTPGSTRCTDGKDNDCDTKIDLADPGCQSTEKCDGKDNDGALAPKGIYLYQIDSGSEKVTGSIFLAR